MITTTGMPATLTDSATACLSEELVARLAAGEISAVANGRAYLHLIECRACARRCRDHPAHAALPAIDGYWLMGEIGRGQTSVVYKAWWRGRATAPVALKIVRPGSIEQQKRFEREVRVLSDLDCPNVVKCLDSGQDRGTLFYAMDYIDGVPLDTYFRTSATTLEARLQVFEKLCRAVSGPHERHVVHRDLKPGNILVTADGQPHVMDFGLCTVDSSDWDTLVRTSATEVGDVRGTVRFMPPEQAWGNVTRSANCKTDIWSLGIILYDVATNGAYPFDTTPTQERSAAEALLFRIRNERPRPPRVTAAKHAAALTLLIERCLAHEPEERLSAAELAENVNALLRNRRLSARRLSRIYQLRRFGAAMAVQQRWALWIGSVAVVLIALSLITQIFQVRWLVTGSDYDRQTHIPTFEGAAAYGRDGVLIAGITDAACEEVPRWAARQGMSNVTSAVKSWRGVHGRLMRRLARVKPRAVVWDYFFAAPQPDDPEFADGVNALHAAGIPVVLAAREFDAECKPSASPEVRRLTAGRVSYGAIMARDMVERPGEVFVAVWRNGRGILSLGLCAVGAMIHPDCDTEIEWTPRKLEMHLKYRNRAAKGLYLGTWDKVELTRVYLNAIRQHGAAPGDLMLCKAFELARPEVWERRTVSYAALLTCTEEELRRQCSGQIMIIGDVALPTPDNNHDRHNVRYGSEVIESVPGCYLQADCIVGLLANRYYKPAFPISGGTYVAIIMSVVGGLTLVATVARRHGARLSANNRKLHATALFACAAISAWLLSTQNAFAVQAAMLSWAGVMGMWASHCIEAARSRLAMPVVLEPGAVTPDPSIDSPACHP